MRALVTNDDGIDSRGLHLLARLAVEAGLDVVVAAPDQEYSGSSAALTALAEDGRLIVHERRLDGVDAERVLAVEATPGFIVMVGARGAFGPAPDLVLSGVNHGPNTGHAVLHSGTVGATLTGATHGIPGLAVSLVATDSSTGPAVWETAEVVTRRALRWLLDHPQENVLNVNVPDVPPDRLRGLRPARLAGFGAVQAEIGESGEGFVTMTFREVDAEPAPDTDVALLREGWATVTALRAPCEDGGLDFPDLDGG